MAEATKTMDVFFNRNHWLRQMWPQVSPHWIVLPTQNITHDTREIKANVEDIEGQTGALSSRIYETEGRVAALENTADKSKQFKRKHKNRDDRGCAV